MINSSSTFTLCLDTNDGGKGTEGRVVKERRGTGDKGRGEERGVIFFSKLFNSENIWFIKRGRKMNSSNLLISLSPCIQTREDKNLSSSLSRSLQISLCKQTSKVRMQY